MQLFSMLADDKNLIIYRPKLREITGSVTATILLQQIVYWYKTNKMKPFFKFKEPCSHNMYKEGDSWCEELGFSRSEFDSAIKKIGKKVKKGSKKEGALVFYWTDTDRKTHYDLNIELLELKLNDLYPTLRKVEKSLYVNQDFNFSKINNSDLHNTETNTETNTNINIYRDIINYLNEKANKSFKHTTKKTKDCIKARLNEKFTLEDFKKVIDIKCEKWLNSKEYNMYLRPETLFGNKFEGYLNEYIEPKKETEKKDNYLEQRKKELMGC